jgi:hypothetical protein
LPQLLEKFIAYGARAFLHRHALFSKRLNGANTDGNSIFIAIAPNQIFVVTRLFSYAVIDMCNMQPKGQRTQMMQQQHAVATSAYTYDDGFTD